MKIIKPSIEYVENFTVTGISTNTINAQEKNPTTAKIPALWQQFYSSDLNQHALIYGVYSGYESDEQGSYTLTVGTAERKNRKNEHTVTIKTGNYLVFKDTGPMPITVINLWQQIWNYFSEEINYQRNFISDFEVYKGTDQVAIYIGIK